jgi:uncharacterized protein (TIGR03435 family)
MRGHPFGFAAFLLCLTSGHVVAQDKLATELLRFEAATIKPPPPLPANVPRLIQLKMLPGGRLVVSALPLKTLIQAAFRLGNWQISGAESWMTNEPYDIEATPPENLRSSIKNLQHSWYSIEDPQVREMLQALLIDRFQLKFHRENKNGDVYLLVKSGKPVRLKEAESGEKADSFGTVGYANGRWVIHATTMAQLAKFASDVVLHAPVEDRTGMSGAFDYEEMTVDPEGGANDHNASFMRLIPEVGLKLERTRGPVETLVIDHAARPTEN